MKKKNKVSGRTLYWILFLIVVSMLLHSCSKGQVGEVAYKFDKYEMIIDKYSVDTAILLTRIVWWSDDRIWKQETKAMLDTTADQWWYMCPVREMPGGWIEHYYYKKNGIKIQPSAYPKSK